jgi:hypothetical protein
MKEHEHMDDALNDAPLLRSLKGAPDPFIVTEGFFERLPHAVQAKVARKRVWYEVLSVKHVVAAMAFVAVVLAVWWALPRAEEALNGTYAELDLDVHPDELLVQDHLVWDVYADPGQPLFGEVLLELDERELFAYLEHENVDVELLMMEP